MKKFLPTWIALGVFGALLAYLLIAKPKTKDEREEASRTLTKTKRESIDRIEVKNGSGDFLFAKQPGGEKWTFVLGTSGVATAPVWARGKTFPVEDTSYNQMLNSLAGLEALDVAWEKPGDAERTKAGLAPKPTSQVRWHSEDGDHTLAVGNATASDDGFYAETPGKPGIWVVRKYNLEVFGKGLDDYRRKKLYDFERDDVRSLTITVKGKPGPLAMSRADPTAPWQVTTPFTGRADRGNARVPVPVRRS